MPRLADPRPWLAVAALFMPAAAQAQDLMLAQVIETAATYCPKGTMEADGRLLAINQNLALFSLLGTSFGGNGRTTFALPDLRPVDASGQRRPYRKADLRRCVAIAGVFPSRS